MAPTGHSIVDAELLFGTEGVRSKYWAEAHNVLVLLVSWKNWVADSLLFNVLVAGYGSPTPGGSEAPYI